jgi:hypothetical protein
MTDESVGEDEDEVEDEVEDPQPHPESTADSSLRSDGDRFRSSSREGGLGDLASRLLRVGAEAVNQTTERIRDASEDVRPRDLVSGAVRMTAKGREEIVGMVAKEVRMYLEKLRVGEELRALMTDHTLEITTSLRLKPLPAKADAAAEPDDSSD